MRTAEIERVTRETKISLSLNLDGTGMNKINTGVGFFDHMLTAFSVHSGFDLSVSCAGDLKVDCHHSVEDVGIALGQAFAKTTSNKAGIKRYGNFTIPMDESLATAVADISGRPYLVFNAEFSDFRVGELDTCMVYEFFYAFAINAGVTLHINLFYGRNDHHKIEAIFKAAAHALKEAVAKTGSGEVLSSKGVL